MTGYAKKECTIGAKKITVEIKTLNSKQLDVITKLPAAYRSKDLDIRTMLGRLERGKIDCLLTEETVSGDAGDVNTRLIQERFHAVRDTLMDMGIGVSQMGHVAAAILSQNDVWSAADDTEMSDAEWQETRRCIDEAIKDCDTFRLHEGNVLQQDLAKHVDIIEEKLKQIPPYEQERIDTVKEHLRKNLAELTQNKVDENRFEQEIIYYLEKLDITEEKVRLAKHIAYFRDTMQSADSNGKKLGFIAQEMGREINTTGSKANHVAIQRLVVEMKDELEKIKEQLANIL